MEEARLSQGRVMAMGVLGVLSIGSAGEWKGLGQIVPQGDWHPDGAPVRLEYEGEVPPVSWVDWCLVEEGKVVTWDPSRSGPVEKVLEAPGKQLGASHAF